MTNLKSETIEEMLHESSLFFKRYTFAVFLSQNPKSSEGLFCESDQSTPLDWNTKTKLGAKVSFE